jgi:hypothetical protein
VTAPAAFSIGTAIATGVFVLRGETNASRGNEQVGGDVREGKAEDSES